jgi:hypothetical protein
MKMPPLNDSIKEKALYLIKPNQYPNQAVEQFELLSLLIQKSKLCCPVLLSCHSVEITKDRNGWFKKREARKIGP